MCSGFRQNRSNRVLALEESYILGHRTNHVSELNSRLFIRMNHGNVSFRRGRKKADNILTRSLEMRPPIPFSNGKRLSATRHKTINSKGKRIIWGGRETAACHKGSLKGRRIEKKYIKTDWKATLEGVTRCIEENPKHPFSNSADNDGLGDRSWPNNGESAVVFKRILLDPDSR